jgi:predicted GH43/DUF377 family glycosyl hydrolase
MKLQRYRGNPILTPRKEHEWEAQAVFNAAVIHHNGLFHMLYRAQGADRVSRIGYAISRDGLDWRRLDRPVLEPANEHEAQGVEDPRVTRIGDTFYMCYTANSGTLYQIALARSQNLTAWERIGFPLPGERNKDAVLFPEKIKGRYCMLHRREPDIWIAYSDDLIQWGDHQVIMRLRPEAWDSYKIGANGPPLKTDAGWLLFYHGFAKDKVYKLGIALLDLEDPTVVLKRGDEPILEPEEEWERHGQVPNVVFSCANLVVDGTVYVYYGGGDHMIGLATCRLEELMQSVLYAE